MEREEIINNYMSVEDLVTLLDYIQSNFPFGCMSKTRPMGFKYIMPSYDTRTGKIFAIRIDNNFFSITNENRGEHLLTWVVEWLNDRPCPEPDYMEW